MLQPNCFTLKHSEPFANAIVQRNVLSQCCSSSTNDSHACWTRYRHQTWKYYDWTIAKCDWKRAGVGGRASLICFQDGVFGAFDYNINSGKAVGGGGRWRGCSLAMFSSVFDGLWSLTAESAIVLGDTLLRRRCEVEWTCYWCELCERVWYTFPEYLLQTGVWPG